MCVYKRWCTRDFVDFLDPFFIRPELQPLQEQFFPLPKLSQMFLAHGTLMSVCANHFYFLPFIIMSVWFAYIALSVLVGYSQRMVTSVPSARFRVMFIPVGSGFNLVLMTYLPMRVLTYPHMTCFCTQCV